MEMTIKEFNKKLNITKEIELFEDKKVKYDGKYYTFTYDKENGVISLLIS